MKYHGTVSFSSVDFGKVGIQLAWAAELYICFQGFAIVWHQSVLTQEPAAWSESSAGLANWQPPEARSLSTGSAWRMPIEMGSWPVAEHVLGVTKAPESCL